MRKIQFANAYRLIVNFCRTGAKRFSIEIHDVLDSKFNRERRGWQWVEFNITHLCQPQTAGGIDEVPRPAGGVAGGRLREHFKQQRWPEWRLPSRQHRAGNILACDSDSGAFQMSFIQPKGRRLVWYAVD